MGNGDLRGFCNRPYIYCDMWDDLAMPDDVDKCDNFENCE